MKKIVLLLLVVLVIIGFFAFASANKTNQETSNKATENNINLGAQSNEYQEVKLKFENYEYKLYPSNLKKDVPVRMNVDLDSVYGCMRDVVISAFNVRKYVKDGDNIIEFTPNKTGTFNIACSMNMGRGRFTVVEADGSTSNYVEPAKTGGGRNGN